jgi:hypothetical protein
MIVIPTEESLMTNVSHATALLIDSFDRIQELVAAVTTDLSDEVSSYRPDQDANSIGWLLWHLSRIQDDHIADAARVDQVWPRWRDRFGLPFGDFATGYGQGPAEVAAVRVSADLLRGYHSDVAELTRGYVEGLTAGELERVVDTRWNPPVTVSVRLVSVIGDCLQHLGQAAYVRGLAERAPR